MIRRAICPEEMDEARSLTDASELGATAGSTVGNAVGTEVDGDTDLWKN